MLCVRIVSSVKDVQSIAVCAYCLQCKGCSSIAECTYWLQCERPMHIVRRMNLITRLKKGEESSKHYYYYLENWSFDGQKTRGKKPLKRCALDFERTSFSSRAVEPCL
ncbi:hypothetical protein CEXT_416481 [Caerostris extrusa]|uniref:Uncharacterized protein n=1 Tax=Caerostris extrusa TaxID=172846 RepID=A0AAV4Y6A0_CAEEX|nr:hypothetical protein CEXT_416481 [Caerostris extrusa]